MNGAGLGVSDTLVDGFSVSKEDVTIGEHRIPKWTGEFWTARQRQAKSIHEISYRACFKAQLPRFFIERLTVPGEIVYDPFSGRGTTVLEAALLGRRIIANDINPVSTILCRPRFFIPDLAALEDRLNAIPFDGSARAELDLSMFFHRRTEAEIVSLRNYLFERNTGGTEDALDGWIRMVATNRLTGHSAGFFSVYTFPPNQAVSPDRQKRINRQRRQKPEYRNTRKIILKKSKSLLRNLTGEDCTRLRAMGGDAVFLQRDAGHTDPVDTGSIQLTVTSPPFLDVVHYAGDNWLRGWFNSVDTAAVAARITMARTVQDWTGVMQNVFQELFRITRNGGWVAFEVGEVRGGRVRLEEHVLPLGLRAGFRCAGLLMHRQAFTKTSHIWGVDNNQKGTNTNRILIFTKP